MVAQAGAKGRKKAKRLMTVAIVKIIISKREIFILGFWKNLCIFGGLLELQSTRLFVGNFPR